MPQGQRVSGITSVAIDGINYMVQDGVTWSPSTVIRETQTGLDSVHGYKELPVAGFVEMTIRDLGVKVEDFDAMKSSTVCVQQANGKQIVMSYGWTVNVREVNAVEGTFAVRFEGPDVVELF